MKTSAKLLLATAALASACSNNSGSNSSQSAGSCSNATINASSSLVTTTNTNSIPVYVADTATTGTTGYSNEPLVSVTICTPNHTSASQCQTISNVLLDTGSYGLRIFGSAIASNVQLQQEYVMVSGNPYALAQCATFGTGADWGAIQTADIVLGNQTATAVPMQVVNNGFAAIPSGCADLKPDTDPCTAGFNGILGIGPFVRDCGADCASTSTYVNPGLYFACSSSNCGDVTGSGSNAAIPVATSLQLGNPIALFSSSSYNNGLSLTLPSVPTSGASALQGTLTFGIGSTAGNAPGSSIAVYSSDSSGASDGNGIDFTTIYNGHTYGGSGSGQAFLDSGSNGYFFPNTTSIATCSNGFFCPTSTQNLTATIAGYSGTPTVSVSFSIANAQTQFGSGHSAFSALGAPQTSVFDWGLPFFFGRTVYEGFDGKSATYNSGSATGPYWAF